MNGPLAYWLVNIYNTQLKLENNKRRTIKYKVGIFIHKQ